MPLLLVATMLAAVCPGAGSAIERSVVFDPGRSTAPWPGQPEGVSAGGCFAAPSLLHISREPAGNPNGTLLLLAVATQPAPARHPTRATGVLGRSPGVAPRVVVGPRRLSIVLWSYSF